MQLELLESIDESLLTFENLKLNGLKGNIQGPRSLKDNLLSFVLEKISPILNNTNKDEIELENIEYKDILHLEVKQTLLPIEHLIEEEQKQLPSDTDVTITAYEIFNDRDLSQDVTSVIFDILEAVKLE